jgi:predicted permease
MNPEHWLYTIPLRLRSLFRRNRVDQELDEELRYHFQRKIEENLARGLSREEATRAARRDFGGFELSKEECRDMRQVNRLLDAMHDLRYAARTLMRNSGFALIAIVTLALGIGANTAIFSVVHTTLLQPLPYAHAEQLVELRQTETAPGDYPLCGEDYLDWRSQNSTFAGMSLYSWPIGVNASGADEPEAVSEIATQANFFQLLGVSPQIGRLFAAGEDRKGAGHVVILSDAFWKTHFGGSADALGKTLGLNSTSYTIIGVMPAWVRSPAEADLWVPLDMSLENIGRRGNHNWKGIGRIKAGVTVEQARADLHTIAERLEKQFPDSNRSVDAVVMPLHEWLVGSFSDPLWIMFGAVGLVLLIACANVANLLLARSNSRRREIAVRIALGAGRARLLRQLLTESLLLSFLGGITGILVAYASVSLFRGILTQVLPQPNPLRVGLVPLAFTFLVCVAAGVLFGLAPALQSSSVESSDALKAKGCAPSGASRHGSRLRNTLVAGEIALSLALLTSAGLLLRTFENLRNTDLGIQPDHVLTAAVKLPGARYKTLDQSWEFYSQLLQKLAASPGVRAVALTSKLPLRGGMNGYILIPGKQTESLTGPLVESSYISPGYFRAMGIPLLEGRDFTRADLEDTAKPSREMTPSMSQEEVQAVTKKYVLPSVINETMARTFWHGEDPLGKLFEHGYTFRIIGVVGDAKQGDVRGAAMPEAYYGMPLLLDTPGWPFNAVVQSTGAPESLVSMIRTTVASLDKSLALFHVRTMPQIIAESMTTTQYETVLLLSMAGLALLLAAVGTYGVMSYVVGQRTNEIGIRMALGARPMEIFAMVLRQAFLLVAVGIVVGWAGAAAGAKAMQSLLFHVPPFDPVTYAGVSAILAGVALAACWIPVLRAMRVDPMVALRDE